MSSERIYESSSGDTWDLVREDARVFVTHTPNLASGGRPSHIALDAFLRRAPHSAEHAALVAMLGASAETAVPPVDVKPVEVMPIEVTGYIHDPKEVGGPYIAVVLTSGQEPIVTLHKSHADAARELEAKLATLKRTMIA